MSSHIKTQKNGASKIEINENTVAEDELSNNTVPNNHVQDFNVSLSCFFHCYYLPFNAGSAE